MTKKQVFYICAKCNPTSYDKSLFTYQNELNVFDDAGTQVQEYVYACNDCGEKHWIDENWIAENGVDDVDDVDYAEFEQMFKDADDNISKYVDCKKKHGVVRYGAAELALTGTPQLIDTNKYGGKAINISGHIFDLLWYPTKQYPEIDFTYPNEVIKND